MSTELAARETVTATNSHLTWTAVGLGCYKVRRTEFITGEGKSTGRKFDILTSTVTVYTVEVTDWTLPIVIVSCLIKTKQSEIILAANSHGERVCDVAMEL